MIEVTNTCKEELKIAKVENKINSENPFYELSLDYDIEVLPYARPRKAKYGGFYNPRDKYKKQLRELFSNDLHEISPIFPVEGEVSITLTFGLTPPKTIKDSKLKMSLVERDIIHPTTRPDIDNYVKPILDALNQVLYEDDGQIFELNTKKVYTDKEPFLHIDVKYRQDKIKVR